MDNKHNHATQTNLVTKNAKRATEEMENNPDKNQHAGGGPGMSLTHPNQSYDSFRKEVGKARSEAIVVQQ